jgi:hypothetical protein
LRACTIEPNYLPYKILIEGNKSIINYNKDDSSLNYEQLAENIKKSEIIKFLENEIKKYSIDSHKELFNEVHNSKLFCERIKTFYDTFILFINEKMNNAPIKIPNTIILNKYNKINNLIINILNNLNIYDFNSKKNIINIHNSSIPKIDTYANAFLIDDNALNIYKKIFSLHNINNSDILPLSPKWNIQIFVKKINKDNINFLKNQIILYADKLYEILKSTLSNNTIIKSEKIIYTHSSNKINVSVEEKNNELYISININYDTHIDDYIFQFIITKTSDLDNYNIFETLKYNCNKYNILNNYLIKYYVIRFDNLFNKILDNMMVKILNNKNGLDEYKKLEYMKKINSLTFIPYMKISDNNIKIFDEIKLN